MLVRRCLRCCPIFPSGGHSPREDPTQSLLGAQVVLPTLARPPSPLLCPPRTSTTRASDSDDALAVSTAAASSLHPATNPVLVPTQHEMVSHEKVAAASSSTSSCVGTVSSLEVRGRAAPVDASVVHHCCLSPGFLLPTPLVDVLHLPPRFAGCPLPQAYNRLIGSPETASDATHERASELNTETCPICTEEIILGPHHLVLDMKRPPGEAPMHFECGHALHADCFAIYVSSKGRQCPICMVESSHTAPNPQPARRRQRRQLRHERGGGGESSGGDGSGRFRAADVSAMIAQLETLGLTVDMLRAEAPGSSAVELQDSEAASGEAREEATSSEEEEEQQEQQEPTDEERLEGQDDDEDEGPVRYGEEEMREHRATEDDDEDEDEDGVDGDDDDDEGAAAAEWRARQEAALREEERLEEEELLAALQLSLAESYEHSSGDDQRPHQ